MLAKLSEMLVRAAKSSANTGDSNVGIMASKIVGCENALDNQSLVPLTLSNDPESWS